MPLAARIGDTILHDDATGFVLTGSATVYVNGIPVTRMGDLAICNHESHENAQDKIRRLITASRTVFAEGVGIARVSDRYDCGAIILTGSPNVFIGG